MNIVLLSGATRIGSHSAKIAEKLQEKLAEQAHIHKLTLIENRSLGLPLYEDNVALSTEQLDLIASTSKLLHEADALILISPEYNGGMSGGLKNTLDYFRPEYSWKPMGLVSVTSGTLGGQNAMQQLTQFAAYVGACIMPTRLMVSEVQEIISNIHSPQAERFNKNADKFVTDMLRFTEKMKV